MINYELAKELKAAGFNQLFKNGEFYTTDAVLIELHEGIEDRHGYYIPTLSELIEACVSKEEEKSIYRLDYDNILEWWNVFGGSAKKHFEGMGKTPEEAVAKLWLKLNKKDDK